MTHHRFVLPRSDGSWLAEPNPSTWRASGSANHDALSRSDLNCQGRTLAELRHLTQQHAACAAARYTSELLGTDVAVPGQQPWIVTGHQPELFHPGVWVKNFAVARLARNAQAVGLNLLVDSDTHTGTEITVPTGSRNDPQRETVPFDDPRPESPWEELPLANRSVFDDFAKRVNQKLHPWGLDPLLAEAWPLARHYADRAKSPRLCDALAAMRAGVERSWQAGNLELPMSRLTTLPGFLWFTAHILAQLPRFRTAYNEIVHSYRRRHHLRSRSHPVPDLDINDDWHEAPFWVWRAGETVRQRLFARQEQGELCLRDRRDVFLRLPLTPERSACCAVEELATLPSRGIRLRSRALTTTLFARLFLSDLFIHGIGGAKYDEMTDELIARFYGLAAPQYATLSATLHLPLGGTWPVNAQILGENRHALWELQHQPERFLSDNDAAAENLLAEKRQLIAEEHARHRQHSILARDQNRRRYLRLREINQLLQPAVKPRREQVVDELRTLSSEQSANRVLANREFSWVLYPEEKLRGFVQSLPIPDESR